MQSDPVELMNPANCLCFGVRKAARALTQAYDAAMAEAGLTGPQFSLLAALGAMEGTSLTALADFLGLDRTTLNRNLKPLQRDGLVESVADDDGRLRRLRVTAGGAVRLAFASRLWRDRQGRLVQSYGAAEARSLLDALSRLSEASRA